MKGSVSSSGIELESDPAYLIGLGVRVREVRDGMSQEEFAREFKVHVNTLRRWESGKRPAEPDFLHRLTKRYPTLNPAWLLTGDGDRVRAEFSTAQDRGEYTYIPLYDVKAAAGHGKVVEAEPVKEVLAFRSDWLRQELQATPADVRLLFVAGDSMEPDLRAGDIVMIDIRDTGASFEGYYVLRLDGALLVKQLQRLPGGVLEVSSRNAAYKSFTVKLEQLDGNEGFAIIGRVVWACRRV